jgi:glycolate oxidase iron-sulfur subunit
MLSRLLVDAPGTLSILMKIAYAAKRAGLSALSRPLLRVAGLSGLAEADAHVTEAPFFFLSDKLKRRKRSDKPAWLYFAPCGPNYLFPRVGLATVKALEALRGEGDALENGCCGLLSYNYGEVEDARVLARRVIERAERAAVPVVGDCSSCVAFLKSYPQLFAQEVGWRERAERFAARVQDAVEAFAHEAIPAGSDSGVVTYHESCRACHGQGLKTPKDLLRGACGDSFRPLEEADVCCGGAGAFSFVNPELSDEVLKRKIDKIARARATVVLTSSTSCLIQLARGLRKYYPQGKVLHLSEFTAKRLGQGKP